MIVSWQSDGKAAMVNVSITLLVISHKSAFEVLAIPKWMKLNSELQTNECMTEWCNEGSDCKEKGNNESKHRIELKQKNRVRDQRDSVQKQCQVLSKSRLDDEKPQIERRYYEQTKSTQKLRCE